MLGRTLTWRIVAIGILLTLPPPALAAPGPSPDGVNLLHVTIVDAAHHPVDPPLEAGREYTVRASYEFTATFDVPVFLTTECAPIDTLYWEVLTPNFVGFDRESFNPYLSNFKLSIKEGRFEVLLHCAVPLGATGPTAQNATTLAVAPGETLHFTNTAFELIGVRSRAKDGEILRSSKLVEVKDDAIHAYDRAVAAAEERVRALKETPFVTDGLRAKATAMLDAAKALAAAGRVERAGFTAQAVPGTEDFVDPAPWKAGALGLGAALVVVTVGLVVLARRTSDARALRRVLAARLGEIEDALEHDDGVVLKEVVELALLRGRLFRRPRTSRDEMDPDRGLQGGAY